MIIKVEIDMSAEWDHDLIEHMATCATHQMTMFQYVQGALVDAISRGWHLQRETISFSLGIPEKDDHTLMLLDDLSEEERTHYEELLKEYQELMRVRMASDGESQLPEQLYGKANMA